MGIMQMQRPHMRVRYTASGGGGGGGMPAWRAALRQFQYTPPTGIDTYGFGTVLDTTWNLAGQTGTTHTCTTQAHVTTALGAANPGDKIVINANLVAPSGGWVLGNRGTGTIYIVSSYINAGTFERSASVSDWSALTESEWATAVSASRARKADTYRTLENDTGNSGQDAVFMATAAKSTRWVIAGLEMKPNASNALTAFTNFGLVRIEKDDATNDATTAGRVWVDRCYLHASATQNMRRAVSANGSEIAVTNSCIAEVHERGIADVQCIAKWNGGGPLKIINNTLECAGQAILTGGSAVLEAVHPCDVEIRANQLVTPLKMLTYDSDQATGPWAGIDYRGKCLYESKFCKRLWFEGNELKNARGVFGWALVLQSLSQSTPNTYVVTENVAMRQTRVRSMTGGLNFTGRGADEPTDTALHRLGLLDVIVTGIIATDGWGMITNSLGTAEMYGVTLDGDSVRGAWEPEGTSEGDLTVNGLIAPYGTYSVFRTGAAVGDDALDAMKGSFAISMSNSVMWGDTSAPTFFNGTCNMTLLAGRANVGFTGGTAEGDVTGTYATNKANATLIAALTDPLNVEAYS